jgi:DNA-binding XRE family transcriptional regulator
LTRQESRTMADDRDPRSDLGAWLGEELRRVRVAAGFRSQDQVARRLGFERTVITKIETGDRPPSADVAGALVTLFPELGGGRFAELAEVARRANGKFPGWFERDWLPVEREAASLRWWEPILIPGLVQTGDYARALFQAWQPASSEDDLDALVTGRLERQGVLDRDDPPDLRAVLDESVLHRLIGSPKIMHDQLEHLADMSCRPMVTVQVIPAELGAHGGLLGAFILAGPSGTVYLETAVEAQITGDDPVRERAALTFDRLTRDALPRGASRDLILKVADEQWNT